MANPNIMSVTAIRGKTIGFVAPTNSATIVSNYSSSGQIIKINSIVAANITGTAATVSLALQKNAVSYTAANAATVGTVTSGAYTLTLAMSAGPFLSTSTSLSGSTIGTGATIGAISISGTNYSIAITGTTGATAGAQASVSWTNPSVASFLESAISVPPYSSLVLVSKDSGIYLEEGDYLYCVAGTASAIHVTCGYEVIG